MANNTPGNVEKNSYVNVAALQALINRIAVLRESIVKDTESTFNDFIENDYNEFKSTVTNQLNEIQAAIQTIVEPAQVRAAYEDSVNEE